MLHECDPRFHIVQALWDVLSPLLGSCFQEWLRLIPQPPPHVSSGGLVYLPGVSERSLLEAVGERVMRGPSLVGCVRALDPGWIEVGTQPFHPSHPLDGGWKIASRQVGLLAFLTQADLSFAWVSDQCCPHLRRPFTYTKLTRVPSGRIQVGNRVYEAEVRQYPPGDASAAPILLWRRPKQTP